MHVKINNIGDNLSILDKQIKEYFIKHNVVSEQWNIYYNLNACISVPYQYKYIFA